MADACRFRRDDRSRRHQQARCHRRRAAGRRGHGLDGDHDRGRGGSARRLERDGDPDRHLDHRRLFRKDRRAQLAVRAIAQIIRRATGAADPGAVDADRHPVDVHRQRGLHPDDGAGGAAAGARARHSGDAAGADDRIQRQLHGHRAAARRPAAADAAQRRRRGVLRFHLAGRAAVVVPDPDDGVHHHACVHVRLRLPPDRQAVGGRRGQHQVRHPGPAVRLHRGRNVPADRAGDGDARDAGRQARLHRSDRRSDPGADRRNPGRQAQRSAELRAHRPGARLARGVLLHRAVRAGRRPGEDAHPRR